jgi:hypothetical protein
MGAILNKIKKCIIVHYGEFEDDILQEWKEEGFVK